MEIAELFVKLGVKGSSESKRSLKDLSDGLGEAKSMSLEAKAGIVAVFYALEQLVAKSNQAGASLTNFNALTGISAETLQRYQYAARQVSVSNGDIESSFKGIQQKMADMRLHGSLPEGISYLNSFLKEGSKFDTSKMDDAVYTFNKLSEAVLNAKQAGLGEGILNKLAQSFGISEGALTAMKRNAFSPEILAKANIYTDAQAKSLEKINVQWANLGYNIEKAFGDINAKYGGKLIQDITIATKEVIELVKNLIELSNRLHVFERISMVIKELAGYTREANKFASLVDTNAKTPEEKQEKKERLTDTLVKFLYNPSQKDIGTPADKLIRSIAPDEIIKSIDRIYSQKAGNTTINQNLNFNSHGENAKQIGGEVKKATSDALRQMNAQAGGI